MARVIYKLRRNVIIPTDAFIDALIGYEVEIRRFNSQEEIDADDRADMFRFDDNEDDDILI